MAEHSASSKLLFNKLTAFAYAQDPDFARGESDVMHVERSTKIAAAFLKNVDSSQQVPRYNEKKILFRAEREPSEEDMRDPSDPIGFLVQQEITTQLPGVPKALRSHLAEALDGCYDTPDSGDFNTVLFAHYSVMKEDDNSVKIDRNIGYELRDYEHTIYEVSELVGQPEPEIVPLAHRQRTLRVYPPIQQEAASDRIEQMTYNILFENLLDRTSNMQLFQELARAREADATVAILGLVTCLRQRETLPDNLL